eukprot:4905632-Amphidinium_carterae.1
MQTCALSKQALFDEGALKLGYPPTKLLLAESSWACGTELLPQHALPLQRDGGLLYSRHMLKIFLAKARQEVGLRNM